MRIQFAGHVNNLEDRDRKIYIAPSFVSVPNKNFKVSPSFASPNKFQHVIKCYNMTWYQHFLSHLKTFALVFLETNETAS